MTKDPTVPEAGFLAVGGSAEGVHLLFFWGGGVPGGCVLRRKALGGEAVLPWPEEGALRLWYTPGWKKEKSGNAKPPVFLLLLLFYFSR